MSIRRQKELYRWRCAWLKFFVKDPDIIAPKQPFNYSGKKLDVNS